MTDSTSGATIASACLHCPRCGLVVRLRSPWLAIVHCPRCVARDRRLIELLGAQLPGPPTHANNSLQPPPEPGGRSRPRKSIGD